MADSSQAPSADRSAELIATFRAVTEVASNDDARRILQVYAWDLDHAVTAYLDNPSMLDTPPSPPPTPSSSAPRSSTQPSPSSSGVSGPPSPSGSGTNPSPESGVIAQQANGNSTPSTTAIQAPNGPAAAIFPRLPRWLFVIFSPIRFVWSFLSNVTTKIIHLLSGPAFLIESAPGNTPTRRFLNFFESRYGSTHPDFHDGSYSSALSTATSQLKFLLVYIHSESHRLTPTFCNEILSDPAFITAANGSFVTWAGSITQRDAATAYHAFRAPALPFMAIVAPSSAASISTQSASVNGANPPLDYTRSQYGTLLSIRAGPTLVSGGSGSAINWLNRVMQRHTQMLDAIRQQRVERESARLLRQQQDEEFARSLEADRRREREAELERQKEVEEQKRLEDVQLRRERKREALGDEPDKAPGVASVVVRLPDGTRVGRRFHQDQVLEQVFDWAEVNGVDIEKACLVMSFPRKAFKYPEDAELKISEAGLFPSAMLLLEERVDE